MQPRLAHKVHGEIILVGRQGSVRSVLRLTNKHKACASTITTQPDVVGDLDAAPRFAATVLLAAAARTRDEHDDPRDQAK